MTGSIKEDSVLKTIAKVNGMLLDDKEAVVGEFKSHHLKVDFIEQLIILIELFDVSQVYQTFVPLALKYSIERTSCIRQKGIELLAQIVQTLLKAEWDAAMDAQKEDDVSTTDLIHVAYVDELLFEVRKRLWTTNDWRLRQNYARFLRTLLDKKLITDIQFCYFFFDDMMRISQDDVPNVRQYFCLLAKLASEACYFSECSESIANAILSRLQVLSVDDADKEICYLARVALDVESPDSESAT